MGRRRKGRKVDGILLLNKPVGITSNTALQRVRYLMYAEKAGHTGSLDPLASGVLPICLGEATKFTSYLLDADKRYLSTIRFGRTTASGDADAPVLTEPGSEQLKADEVEQAIADFRGDITQVPSMYSALKHQGQPLYKLARNGIVVERKARPATIFSYNLLDFRPGQFAEADVEIHCSKGTYVRTLAEDLGEKLGCGAYVCKLHRSAAGIFTDQQTIDLEKLEQLRVDYKAEQLDYLLQPVDAAITDLAKVEMDDSTAWYFCRGQEVMMPQVYRFASEGDIVRIFREGATFLGLGEVTEDGKIAPRRLIAN